VIEEFNRTTGKGPRAQEVLAHFFEGKSVERETLLKNNKSMREEQKKKQRKREQRDKKQT